ncbi:MAG: DUF1822 family protein [Cyanobacteriota bacterium]|nr:DUF1822 family protein [Cyanobacteriota bacterium]
MINNLINLIYNSSDEGRLKVAAQRLGEIKTAERSEVVDALIHLLGKTNNEETRWTAAETLWAIAPNNPVCGARRVKDLKIQIGDRSLGLIVAIFPKPKNKFAVSVRLYSQRDDRLPSPLKLTIVDEDGANFKVAQSKDKDDFIQLKFTGWRGEIFSVQLTSKNSTITEKFAI